MDFDANWRKRQEIAGRPFADDAYKSLFGDCEIQRFERQDEYLLDKVHAIDGHVILPTTGHIITFQEKFLSHEQSKFNSITVEYMQKHEIAKERGDWFKMAVQLYFVAYFNADNSGFCKWVMVDWLQMVMETLKGNIQWKDQINKHDGAQASFKWVNIDLLPGRCVMSKFDDTIQF